VCHTCIRRHNTTYDKIILDLLFDLATWHAYAKLRLHTEDTLAFFDSATVVLGETARKFSRTVCSHYHTTELPQEHAARGRREAALASKQPQAAQGRSAGVKHKSLNLQTYKYHALGDYPNTIRRMGTTDNYSTQPVSITFIQRTPTYTSTTQGELQHRRSKRRFARTPKTKDKMVASIASQEAIERFCEKVITAREHLGAASKNPDQPRRRRQRTSPSDH
jgi:hypothetical protein